MEVRVLVRAMPRAIRFALPFVLLMLVVEHALSFGVRRCSVSASGKVNRVMQHAIDPEIAIFGASNTLTGIDPQRIALDTGLTAYNLALDGTIFAQYQALVRELASFCRRCRYVVLAETGSTFEPRRAIMHPSAYLPYLARPNVASTLDRIDHDLVWKATHVPFYGFVIADQTYYASALRGFMATIGRPPTDGMVDGYLARDGTLADGQAPMTAWTTTPDPALQTSFQELTRSLRARGITPVVVVMPMHDTCSGAFPRYREHRVMLRALMGDSGVFLDYSQHAIGGDRTAFYNCGHLNRSGATRFSELLARDLAGIVSAAGQR